MVSRPRSLGRFSARVAPGSEPGDFPGFIKPMLATLATSVPPGENWIHEIKFDGYRTQAHRRDRKISIFTRRGFNWTDRFASIAAELERIPANDMGGDCGAA